MHNDDEARAKDYGLPSAKERAERRRNSGAVAPRPLSKDESRRQADDQVLKVLGIDRGDKPKQLETPGGDMLLNADRVAHITDDFKAHRECRANRIMPTILDPDEVWYSRRARIGGPEGELRARFIKIFPDGPHGLAIASVCPRTGLLVLFNFIPISRVQAVEKHRRGVLVYAADRI